MSPVENMEIITADQLTAQDVVLEGTKQPYTRRPVESVAKNGRTVGVRFTNSTHDSFDCADYVAVATRKVAA